MLTILHIIQVAVTITNEKSVSTVLSSIGRNLLKTDVTWGKIASLYCVAGGLAIDCVQQGHPEYLYGIVETMGFVIERDAATWIAQQGGWVRTKCIVILYCDKIPKVVVTGMVSTALLGQTPMPISHNSAAGIFHCRPCGPHTST